MAETQKKVIVYDWTQGGQPVAFRNGSKVITAMVLGEHCTDAQKPAQIVEGLAAKLNEKGIKTSAGVQPRYGGVMGGLGSQFFGFLTTVPEPGYSSDIQVLVSNFETPNFGARRYDPAVAVELDASEFAESDRERLRSALEDVCRQFA